VSKLIRPLVIVVGVVAAVFVVVPLLAVGAMAFVLTGGPGCWFVPHPDQFVRQVWVEADPDGECGARYGMVNDLLANHLRRGMPKAEVIALLGAPEDPDYGYMLGCWIDCDWVTVEFDADDRVRDAYQSQD
jgi:hypothetical protein